MLKLHSKFGSGTLPYDSTILRKTRLLLRLLFGGEFVYVKETLRYDLKGTPLDIPVGL
jgi:hypothetical protein